MMASQKNGTLYIGVTSDLPQRVYEHEHGMTKGFTTRYNVTRLVWFEEHDTMMDAIEREKSLKKYKRAWKINLIETHNPHWQRLHPETGAFI